MATERLRRRIEQLLDEAEEALVRPIVSLQLKKPIKCQTQQFAPE